MTTNTIFKKTLSSLAVAALSLSIFTAQAITFSPASIEVTADPGETISNTVMLINEQDSEQTFYTSVENFEPQGETGTPNFVNSKEGIPSWLTIGEKITLKKGERVSVPYTITVPAGTEAGGYFAAILFSTVPPAVGEGEVSVGAKTGPLVLLKVTGDIKENGGLINFVIKGGKKMFTSLPISFEYRFSNKGSDRVNPQGDIVVTNMFGAEVARIDANKANGNVLPTQTRRYEAKLGDVEAPALSAPFFDHVSFQWNNFSLGMYTATLNLSFGKSGTALSTVTYFMLPWQLLTVVLVTLLVIILVLVVLIKRYNKWVIQQARAAAK